MRMSFTTLAPLSLAALLACGGKSQSDPAPAPSQMPNDTAESLIVPFETTEANQAGEMDGSGPVAAGEALAMVQPHHPDCVTVSNVTSNSVTWTFNNCTGPHGWTWNGVVVISWQANQDGTVMVKHNHQNFAGTKDGRTWTINGVKDHLRNPSTKMVTLSAEPGFTKTFSNGSTTTTFAYTCAMTADWSTTGQRKLSGTWSLTPATGDAITGTISSSTPLVWDHAANCCYPVSGTLTLTKGSQTATIVHSLPCGSITINGTAKTLPACSM